MMSENRKNIKILIATGIYPPDIGGPATYSKLLKDELPKRGIGVEVLSFGEVRYLPKVIRHLAYFFKVLRRGKGADVVFAQDPVSVGLPALCAAKLLRKKFFIRVAGDYAWEQASQRFGVKDTIDDFQSKSYGVRTTLLRWVQKTVVGGADAVVTPSEYFKKLVSGWTNDPGKVHVIYNGVSFEGIPQCPPKTHASKTLFSAGRLVPWKGFDVLIGMMKDLPDWRLMIAGDGPDRERLEAFIRDSGVGERVALLGSLERGVLFEKMCASDIFVLNTSFESFSFQTVEAMYAGVPVIATAVGSLPELITDGTEGLLVEPNSKKQIQTAIDRIHADASLCERITANAQEKAQQFSLSRTLDGLEKLLRAMQVK